MSSSVSRIRRTDAEGYIVLRAQQGRLGRLDVDLLATDGESPFVGKIKHAAVEKLQARAYSGSLQEWHDVLSAVLLSVRIAPVSDLCENTELTATVGEVLVLSIRETVDGITRRLGEITLELQEDAEINLFDWLGESASRTEDMQKHVVSLESQMYKGQQLIAQLKVRLDQTEDEREKYIEGLLRRFTTLLNSKKLKIRNQQRLLAQNSIGSTGLEVGDGDSRRPCTSSSTAKRKADADGNVSEASHQEDGTNTSETSERRATPELMSDEEQGSDVDAIDGKSAVPPQRELPFASARVMESEVGQSKSKRTRHDMLDRDSDTEDEL